MAGTYGAWRVSYLHGPWTVLSGPTSLVVLEPAAAADGDFLEKLWGQLLNCASITEITATLTAVGLDSMANLGVFFWDDENLHCLLRGSLQVCDAQSGAEIACGKGAYTWREADLVCSAVRVKMDESANPAQLALPLVVGAVQASDIYLDAHPAAQARDDVSAVSSSSDAVQRASERSPEMSVPVLTMEVPPDLSAWGEDDDDPLGHVDEDAPESKQHSNDQSALPDGGESVIVPGEIPQAMSPVPLANAAGVTSLPSASVPAAGLSEGSDEPASAPARYPRSWPEEAGRDLQSSAGPEPTEQLPRVEHDADPASAQKPTDDLGRHDAGWPQRFSAPGIAQNSGIGAPGELGAANQPLGPAGLMGPWGAEGFAPDAKPVRLSSAPRSLVLCTALGERVPVEGAVLIGRAPTSATGEQVLRVPSPNHDISRTHIRVSPADGGFEVTDMHSTNGTVIIFPHGQQLRLDRGETAQVPVGAEIDLGDGQRISLLAQ